jgi:16S rRNA (guanine527-N7)-methyltransferase
LKPETRNQKLITRYFPLLTEVQMKQFEQIGPLYREWNAKLNVISRKDIDNLYERHILHSLSIAKVIDFRPGTKILDAGTGGGFPGMPLAIVFPQVHFHLIDSTAKKLTVVQNISGEIGLKNITTEHSRLENHRGLYDFVISRAVASLDNMILWVRKNVKKDGMNQLDNGILYLKGGEILDELQNFETSPKLPILKSPKQQITQSSNHPMFNRYAIYQLSDFFKEEFFQTKKLIHIY